jgi:predicted dinucleotide-binding enzyme
MVGNTIGSKLISLGHNVMMGSRTAGNEKATAWAASQGISASNGTYADAAAFGELIFNCTSGIGSMEAFKQAGAADMNGKVVIDISNPLDFSKGMPPSLSVCNTDSLSEQLQREFPEAKIVKTLNTVNCNIMVNPAMLAGDHDMMLCGNDIDAKVTVKDILMNWFGWKTVHDLGDLTGARGMEMWLPLWLRFMMTTGTANFNIRLVK